jgi:predicted nucleic acid-binding protein
MSGWVVLDSGILLASILVEEHTEQSKALLSHWRAENIQIAAPTLFRYELVAVMRKNVYRATLSADQAIEGLAFLLAQPIQLMMDDQLLKRGFELATMFNRPTAYDSQYLAVAERLGCDFWTADEKLFNAVNSGLPWVKWIGNFTSGTA